MWAGVAVVIVSSVGFTGLLAQAGRRIPVLAVVRSIPAGTAVTAADLREVRLGVDDASGQVIRAAEEDSVVGRPAVVPLVAGALLSPQEFGGRVRFPPAGQAQVSFAVEPGGVPAGLDAGERVAVLPGPAVEAAVGQSGDGVTDDVGTGSVLVGTVTDVAAGDQDSGTVVTVLVDTAAAARAVRVFKPHLVVLSPVDREVP